MSSNIMSSTHFNSVQRGIENYLEARKDFHYSLNPVFDSLFTVAKVKNFMDTLRRLNVLCVCYQYQQDDNDVEIEIQDQTEILFDDLKTIVIINNTIDLIVAKQLDVDFDPETTLVKEIYTVSF